MPREKNEWYHRFATKTLFQHPKHNTSCLLEKLKLNKQKSRELVPQEDCFTTTEQITDLEVFGTEKAGLEVITLINIKSFTYPYHM